MKKFLGMMVLVGATMLTGCGSDNDDFVFTGPDTIAGAPAPIPTPDPTPDPVPVVNGFFVDAATGNDATGSFEGGLPFLTLQGATAAAPPGSDIIVRPGNYSDVVELEDGDRLLGSGSALATNPDATVRPVLQGPIVLADGNTADFVRVDGSFGDAIDGNGQNGGTVTNCELINSGDDGIGLSPFSGDWTIENNLIDTTGPTGVGIPADTLGTTIATIRINDNIIQNCTLNAMGFVISESSQLNAQITGNTMTGNQTGFTFEVIGGQTSISCFDIEGNTNDDTYIVSGVSTSTATINVEEFTNLVAVNNNSGTTSTGGGSIPPTSVADGTCGF